MAQALYQFAALRLKQNPTYCGSAIAAYKDVASRYDDSAMRQKAAADLTEPVTFSRLSPISPRTGLRPRMCHGMVRPPDADYFSDDYVRCVDAQAIATFQNVVPGVYNFSLLQRDGFHTYWRKTDPFNPYTETGSPHLWRDSARSLDFS